METMQNNVFSNNSFKKDEFDFLEHMDSDIEYSDKMLEQEQKNKNTIIELINKLNDAIFIKQVSHEFAEKEQSVLDAAKNTLELINYNIAALQANCEDSNSVKKNIIDLLIRIENDERGISQNKYINEINDIKDRIISLNNNFQSSKSIIEINNKTISDFFNTSSVKDFLNAFSLNYEVEFTKNIIKPTLNDKKSFEFSTNLESFKENNNVLLISEKRRIVFLPYSKDEVMEYLKQYPNQYSSFEDVIKKEFIFSTEFYLKHPVIARFREAYSLIRDRESKSILDAFKYALEIMFHYDLNPVIIAACKSQSQLENYLQCLAKKDLTQFKDFEIKFEVSPLKTHKKQSF